MGKTLDDLRAALRDQLPELRHRYGLRSMEVFGSYVRGEQRPDSDLDLLVEFDPAKKRSLYDLVALEQHLSDLLDVRVDLVEKRGIKPALRTRIIAEAVLL
jgi:predicted nucleotidyltransferase